MTDAPLRYDQRPIDDTPVHTTDLPPTPVRDRNIPATAWIEAPGTLLELGTGLEDTPTAQYKRRIGPWLLWRAGPATKAAARYFACAADDLSCQFVFTLDSDGNGHGTGPSGTDHARFRDWKIDLKANAPSP